ncbi:MAG TPA: NAD(P)H-dependent oxidoreductase [Flavisolibacter sp.]|jgi:glutathione-regulated potassium-efflux system ancillary protein KefG|nr:NAD(P)H-dependent oxidoreductase [Flavisolibacter sp.]
MANVLVLFAHPLLEKSRIHSELLKTAKLVNGVTINDLYDRYPDFDIDVEREKKLLLEHDIIIWQYPLYWYSCPPLLKQWLDLVLEHGWAYGKKGTALTGKKVFSVLSTGGSAEAYQPRGYNKYTIHDYLRPFERSAELCHMVYWPPYWVHSSHRMEASQIRQYAEQYKNLLTALTKDIFSEEEINSQQLMNQLFPIASTNV